MPSRELSPPDHKNATSSRRRDRLRSESLRQSTGGYRAAERSSWGARGSRLVARGTAFRKRLRGAGTFRGPVTEGRRTGCISVRLGWDAVVCALGELVKSVIALPCLVSLAGCSVMLAGIDWDQHQSKEWDVGTLYTTGDGRAVTAVVVGSRIGNVGSRTGGARAEPGLG
jgi:hypothetical protein